MRRSHLILYLRRTGGSAYVRGALGTQADVAVSLVADELSALTTQVGWGLLGGGPARGHFRGNPEADELHVRGLATELRLGTAATVRRGWHTRLQAEACGRQLGGQAVYRRYLVDVRRYQPLPGRGRLDLRARLGTAQGQVPNQFLFALGGYGSLRGYPFKAYPGDRMALFTAEYWRTDRVGVRRHRPTLGGFVDGGAGWFGRTHAGTGDQDPDLRTSVGCSLAWRRLRLFLARPLERSQAGWALTGQLSDTF